MAEGIQSPGDRLSEESPHKRRRGISLQVLLLQSATLYSGINLFREMQVNEDTDPGLRRRASPHSEEEGLKEKERQEDGEYKPKVQGCIIHLQYCIPQ